MNEIIHIACSTDDNYASLCGVMLCSLLENNKKNIIHIHVLISKLKQKNKQKIVSQCEKYTARYSFHEIDDMLLDGCKFRTQVHRLSKAAYYRILLPSILKDIDKVIYLDCDMIVLSDLYSLYSMNIDFYGLAAVRDYTQILCEEHLKQLCFEEGDQYFNSGFLLINLKYWRDNDVEKDLLSFSKSDRKVFFHDQDALNYVFRNKWLRIAPAWNRYNVFNIHCKALFLDRNEMRVFEKSPYVVHYPGNLFKPWFTSWYIPQKKTWEHYMSISEWKDFGYLKNPSPVFAFSKVVWTKMKFLFLSKTQRYLI